jgi:hypothetical protein
MLNIGVKDKNGVHRGCRRKKDLVCASADPVDPFEN